MIYLNKVEKEKVLSSQLQISFVESTYFSNSTLTVLGSSVLNLCSPQNCSMLTLKEVLFYLIRFVQSIKKIVYGLIYIDLLKSNKMKMVNFSIFNFQCYLIDKISRKHKMLYSVSQNSNSTALLRAKQPQQSFQRFCEMVLTSS